MAGAGSTGERLRWWRWRRAAHATADPGSDPNTNTYPDANTDARTDAYSDADTDTHACRSDPGLVRLWWRCAAQWAKQACQPIT